ncbi:chondroitin lyase, partial [Shewanella sp. ER-Te-42B-Light]|nr:chondroitin lyase [Shewanella metallivivens]
LASVLETHGYFNEEFEQSVNARGKVIDIKVLGHDEVGSVVQITTNNSLVTLMVSNQITTVSSPHSMTVNQKDYQWTGPYAVDITAIKQEK